MNKKLSDIPVSVLDLATIIQGDQSAGTAFWRSLAFAPAQLMQALEVYRSHFTPSDSLDKPYSMACVNVIAADDNEEAVVLATSFYQLALGLFRNDRKPLPPPVDSMLGIWTEREEQGVRQMLSYAFIGNLATIQPQLQAFADSTGVDEIMVTTHLFEASKKIGSLELTASLFKTNAQ